MVSRESQAMIATYAQFRLGIDAPARTHEELRVMSAEIAAAQPPAQGVQITAETADGVPIERTRPIGSATTRHVVYVHGGGYVCGSAGGQRAFLAELARAADAEVHSVEYRLAPEHRCPAAVDDVVAATRAVQEQFADQPVVVGGDSAGGGLAVAAVLEMRARGHRMPSAMFALSPWADMTLEDEAFGELAERDVMVRLNDLQMMRACYLDDEDPADRRASPALADLDGLPPLMVQVGSEEVLLGDARRLVEKAAAHGVSAELTVAEGMFHTWPVLAPDLPESREAIAALAQFVADA